MELPVPFPVSSCLTPRWVGTVSAENGGRRRHAQPCFQHPSPSLSLFGARPRSSQIHRPLRADFSKSRETPGHEAPTLQRSSCASPQSDRTARSNTHRRTCLHDAATRKGPELKTFREGEETRGEHFPSWVEDRRHAAPADQTRERRFRPGIKRRREGASNYNRVLSVALRSLYAEAATCQYPQYSPLRPLASYRCTVLSRRDGTSFLCRSSRESSVTCSPPRRSSTSSSDGVSVCSPPAVEVVEILDDPEEAENQEEAADGVAVILSDPDSEEEEERLRQLQKLFKEHCRRRRLRGEQNEAREPTCDSGKGGKVSDRVEEIGERCLDMERGVEEYEDFFQLNADEKALWLALKFIHLYQRCTEKVATPGTMSRSLRKMKETVENLFPSNVIGPGSLRLMPGFRCLYTGQLSAVGLHCAFNDRMCIGHDDESLPTVTSLLLNDDRIEDNNDIIIVYGEENDGKGYGAYPGDQMLFIGGTNTRNYSLWNAWKLEYPVRVVRGYKCKSKYAPSFGFRYDGLYRVVEMLADSNNSPSAFHRPSRSPASAASPSSSDTGDSRVRRPLSRRRPVDPVSPGQDAPLSRRADRGASDRPIAPAWEQTETEIRKERPRTAKTENCDSAFPPAILPSMRPWLSPFSGRGAADPARPQGVSPTVSDGEQPQPPSGSTSRSLSFSRLAAVSPESSDPDGDSDASSARRCATLARGRDDPARKYSLGGARQPWVRQGTGEQAADSAREKASAAIEACSHSPSLAQSFLFRNSTRRFPDGGEVLRNVGTVDSGRRSAGAASTPWSHSVSPESPSPSRRQRRRACSSLESPSTVSARQSVLSGRSSFSDAAASRGGTSSSESRRPTSPVPTQKPGLWSEGEHSSSRGPFGSAAVFEKLEKEPVNSPRSTPEQGSPSGGGAAAGGPYGKRERQQLEGRRIYKFVLVSIHRDIYLAPESKLPDRDIAIFSHHVFEDDKGLKKVKALAHHQYRAHYKIQEQLQASLPTFSRSTKVVQVWSDLPFPFALAVPPVLKLPGQSQSILSNFVCIMASAYKIYTEIKRAMDPSASEIPSGALLAVQQYQAAVSLSASPSSLLSKTCSRTGPRCSALPSRSRLPPVAPPSWALCGLLPLKVLLTLFDLELQELSPASKARLIEQARVDCKRHPPGYLESKRDNALPSFSKSPEELAELLAQLKNKPRVPGRHRPLVWRESQTEILVTAELAKIFAHQLLPQSATCGMYSTIELCSPLPDSWSPWQDISQGKEKFPVPAVNDVDDLPPPVDFSYQVRNVCFSRLPNFCMLCLCAGCVPPDKDTSIWERIEVEGYSSGLRDPETGRVYCAGSNLSFVKETSTLAVCTSYCLCDKTVCTNRYPEDLAYPVMVAKTKLAGWELRTQVEIPAGAFIMQYVGEIMCRATMEGRSRHNSRRGYHNYCMEIVQDEWDWEDNWKLPCIDSLFLGNASRFLNHSCEPNVEVRNIWRGPLLPVVGVFSRRAIKAGEALTYAYGAGYETIKCWCGAKTCKGYIGDGTSVEKKEEGKRADRELRKKVRNAADVVVVEGTEFELVELSDDETQQKKHAAHRR
uniref:SET domain containing protein, putative n=1 Tax=Neospora caninum (strain Liverpool) TaxID=572307 RepID=A0A0F7UB60_NEOCL|nr:TPA: SET domain containing protein, putative [Neospora caninum Liverpool]